jgi:serine/threonine-protein kinase
VLRQVAAGLAVLHEAGVVHRDLKPGNILIDADGVAKIADFGISRIDLGQIEPQGSAATLPAAVAASDLTATGALLGTPHYMPPEAAKGGQVFGRAGDLFAFGLVAYELIMRRPAFAIPAVVLAMSGQAIPIPEPIALPGELASLSELFAQCLAADPAARPSAERLRDALASTLEKLGRV